MPNKYLIIATVQGIAEEIDYASNKAEADLLVQLYREELGIKVIVKAKLNQDYQKESIK